MKLDNFSIKVYPEDYDTVIKGMKSLGYKEDKEFNVVKLNTTDEYQFLTCMKGTEDLILLFFSEEEEYFESYSDFLDYFLKLKN